MSRRRPMNPQSEEAARQRAMERQERQQREIRERTLEVANRPRAFPAMHSTIYNFFDELPDSMNLPSFTPSEPLWTETAQYWINEQMQRVWEHQAVVGQSQIRVSANTQIDTAQMGSGVQEIPLPMDAPQGPPTRGVHNHVQDMLRGVERVNPGAFGIPRQFGQPPSGWQAPSELQPLRVLGCIVTPDHYVELDTMYVMRQVVPMRTRGYTGVIWGADSSMTAPMASETIESHVIEPQTVRIPPVGAGSPLGYLEEIIHQVRSHSQRDLSFEIFVDYRTFSRLQAALSTYQHVEPPRTPKLAPCKPSEKGLAWEAAMEEAFMEFAVKAS